MIIDDFDDLDVRDGREINTAILEDGNRIVSRNENEAQRMLQINRVLSRTVIVQGVEPGARKAQHISEGVRSIQLNHPRHQAFATITAEVLDGLCLCVAEFLELLGAKADVQRTTQSL